MVHLNSLDSLAFALGVIGFRRVRPEGRWVHPGSFGSLGFALEVVGFIRGCSDHSGSPLGSLG